MQGDCKLTSNFLIFLLRYSGFVTSLFLILYWMTPKDKRKSKNKKYFLYKIQRIVDISFWAHLVEIWPWFCIELNLILLCFGHIVIYVKTAVRCSPRSCSQQVLAVTMYGVVESQAYHSWPDPEFLIINNKTEYLSKAEYPSICFNWFRMTQKMTSTW